MARCGCSGACSCMVVAGDNATVTGSGSSASPYVISAVGGGGGGFPPDICVAYRQYNPASAGVLPSGSNRSITGWIEYASVGTAVGFMDDTNLRFNEIGLYHMLLELDVPSLGSDTTAARISAGIRTIGTLDARPGFVVDMRGGDTETYFAGQQRGRAVSRIVECTAVGQSTPFCIAHAGVNFAVVDDVTINLYVRYLGPMA